MSKKQRTDNQSINESTGTQPVQYKSLRSLFGYDNYNEPAIINSKPGVIRSAKEAITEQVLTDDVQHTITTVPQFIQLLQHTNYQLMYSGMLMYTDIVFICIYPCFNIQLCSV